MFLHMSIFIFIHSHIVAMWNTVQLCVERSYKSVCLGCFQLSYIDKLYSHCSSEQTLITKNGLGVASALNCNHPVWANKHFMISVSLTCFIDSILFPQFEDTALFWLNWSRWAAYDTAVIIIKPAAVEADIQAEQLAVWQNLHCSSLSLNNRNTEIDSSCCNGSSCSYLLQRDPFSKRSQYKWKKIHSLHFVQKFMKSLSEANDVSEAWSSYFKWISSKVFFFLYEILCLFDWSSAAAQ